LEGSTVLTFSHVIDRDRVSVMFNAKADERIRRMLKINGFRWSPVGGFWWHRQVKGFADILRALEGMIGPRKPDGACWHCKAPEGFFRRQGPATPVYCDACWAIVCEKAGKAEHCEPTADRSDLAYEDRCREACGL
jgi:hypothetical protein